METLCRLITTYDEAIALSAEWDALAARVKGPCFSTFGPFAAWFETVGQNENHRPHIVALWREGRLRGLLPLVLTRKHGLRLVRWAGHDVFFGPTQLFETDADRVTLWDTFLSQGGFDLAKIKYIFDGTPEKKRIEAQRAVLPAGSDRISRIDFAAGQSGADWFEGLSHGTRKDFRRKSNALAKQGEVRFCAWTSGHIPYDRIERQITFKGLWAQANDKKSALFNSTDFLMNLIRRADTDGTICIHDLRCGDETTALSICFIKNETLYDYIATRHPDWSRFSPGSLIMAHGVMWAADQGLKHFDMFEGPDAYKDRFASCFPTFQNYLFAGSLRGRLALALYRLARLRRPR